MEVQRSHDCWPDYWGRFRVRKRCECFADSAFHQLKPFLSFFRAQIGSVFANSFATTKWRTCLCRRHSPSLPRTLPDIQCSIFGISRTLGRIFIQGVGWVSRFISHVAVLLVKRVRLLQTSESLYGLLVFEELFNFFFSSLASRKSARSQYGSLTKIFVSLQLRQSHSLRLTDTALWCLHLGGRISCVSGGFSFDKAGLGHFGALVGDFGEERIWCSTTAM